MPETKAGRALIMKYLSENNIPQNRLAAMYGVNRSYVNQVLSGKLKNKSANVFIIKVISDFGLEG